MLVPAEVIRRAERFKSSIAISPGQTPAIGTGTQGAQPWSQREHDTPAAALTNTCPPQSTAKRQKEGFPSWGLEEDTVWPTEILLPISPNSSNNCCCPTSLNLAPDNPCPSTSHTCRGSSASWEALPNLLGHQTP